MDSEAGSVCNEHMAAQHKALTQPPVNTDSVPLPLRKMKSFHPQQAAAAGLFLRGRRDDSRSSLSETHS
ncbi:hypothetical protein ILYODFUR_007321 [Ilyodon furcidens]|uniref:Uncharacterized protein n=1 Tax=Ilyodon furcidens TaxID=33524 RepID=A0ABV0SWD9_9TELE